MIATGVFAVGAPIPAVGLTGLMYAYVFSGVGSTGALAGGACARLITGDPKAPSAWTNLVSGAFSVTASGPRLPGMPGGNGGSTGPDLS